MRLLAVWLLVAVLSFPVAAHAAPDHRDVSLEALRNDPAAYEGLAVRSSGFIINNPDEGASIYATPEAARDNNDYAAQIAVLGRRDQTERFPSGRWVQIEGVFRAGGFGELRSIPYALTEASVTIDESVPLDPVWWLSPAFVAVFALLAVVGAAVAFHYWTSVAHPGPALAGRHWGRSPFRGR